MSRSPFLLFFALRTNTLYHVVDGNLPKAFRQLYFWNGNILQTVCTATSLTKEVDMQVVIHLLIVTATQLVAYAVAAVFNDVYQMVFAKERQCAEYSRLVNGQDLIFQFCKRQGSARLRQSLDNNDAIGRRLHAMMFQKLNTLLLVHLHLIIY